MFDRTVAENYEKWVIRNHYLNNMRWSNTFGSDPIYHTSIRPLFNLITTDRFLILKECSLRIVSCIQINLTWLLQIWVTSWSGSWQIRRRWWSWRGAPSRPSGCLPWPGCRTWIGSRCIGRCGKLWHWSRTSYELPSQRHKWLERYIHHYFSSCL